MISSAKFSPLTLTASHNQIKFTACDQLVSRTNKFPWQDGGMVNRLHFIPPGQYTLFQLLLFPFTSH